MSVLRAVQTSHTYTDFSCIFPSLSPAVGTGFSTRNSVQRPRDHEFLPSSRFLEHRKRLSDDQGSTANTDRVAANLEDRLALAEIMPR